MELTLVLFHALAGGFFTTSSTWEAHIYTYMHTHTHTHTYAYMHPHTTCRCILGMILNSKKKVIYLVTYRIAFQNAVNKNDENYITLSNTVNTVM